jgi:hypothetical protein
LAHATSAHFEHDLLAAPAAELNDLAAVAANALAAVATPSDLTFDLRLGPNDAWTFHLHVREP